MVHRYNPWKLLKQFLTKIKNIFWNDLTSIIYNKHEQILDKYVGESEANIRRLFADAEEEEKRMGANSGLHIIIFDEIDAICKARGSVAGNSGVNDTVVNQLLSKIDGVDQLNNILVSRSDSIPNLQFI